jgi:hypothetical protein
MSEIGQVLKGLGSASLNPLALVAYVIAVMSWAYLRYRVEINKNLLQPNAFSREARLDALRVEWERFR